MTVDINLIVGEYMASRKIGVLIGFLSTSPLSIYLTLAEILCIKSQRRRRPERHFLTALPCLWVPSVPGINALEWLAPQQRAFPRASERYLVRGESNA